MKALQNNTHKIMMLICLSSLLLTSCHKPHPSSDSSSGDSSSYEQPEEHGEGKYNYDELAYADVDQVIKEYCAKYAKDGAKEENIKGFYDVNVYFEQPGSNKKTNEISYSYKENAPFGPYELRDVAYLDGTYYKLNIDINNTASKPQSYFDVTFEGDDQGTSANKKGYYGMSIVGYDGDYNFSIKPNNKYLLTGKTQFDFKAHINHNNFKVLVNDVSVFTPCDVSYTGMNELGDVKYYYAPINDGVVGEYQEYLVGSTLPIGQYMMKATAHLGEANYETKSQPFSVLPLTFDGATYIDNYDFSYQGSHLNDYVIETPIIINNVEINDVTIEWLDPLKVIDMTTAVDGVVSLIERVQFSKEYYADFVSNVTINIAINDFALTAISDVIYNGEEQEPEIVNYVPELMEIDEESVVSAKDVGEYQATVRFKNGIKGQFTDGSNECLITWNILKANPETFYDLNNNNGHYELELMNEEGNVVSAGRENNYDHTFSIPSSINGKRSYIKLYWVIDQERKLLEVDGMYATKQGELSSYGYDENGVYIDCDANNFSFESTLQFGTQDETNFETYNITFNCYILSPYENELLLDKEHQSLATLYHTNGITLGQDNDDYYFKAPINKDHENSLLIGLSFESLFEIRIQFAKSDKPSLDGRLSLLLGNDLEAIASEDKTLPFDSDWIIKQVSIPSHEYEMTLIFNSLYVLTSLTAPLYLKLAVFGGHEGEEGSCYIKSIAIRYSGTIHTL